MSLELPKVMALWSNEGDHTGFMLLAPKSGSEAGDCVFLLSPSSNEGIDSDLGMVVSELKVAGEHKFKIDTSNDGLRLSVTPTEYPEVIFRLNRQFSGQIVTEFGGRNVCIGSAKPAKKNA